MAEGSALTIDNLRVYIINNLDPTKQEDGLQPILNRLEELSGALQSRVVHKGHLTQQVLEDIFKSPTAGARNFIFLLQHSHAGPDGFPVINIYDTPEGTTLLSTTSAAPLLFHNSGFTVLSACNETAGDFMSGEEPPKWETNVLKLAEHGGHISAQAGNSFSFVDTLAILDAIRIADEVETELKNRVTSSAAMVRLQIQIGQENLLGPFPVTISENLQWFQDRSLSIYDEDKATSSTLEDYYSNVEDESDEFKKFMEKEWPNFSTSDGVDTWLKYTFQVEIEGGAFPSGASFKSAINLLKGKKGIQPEEQTLKEFTDEQVAVFQQLQGITSFSTITEAIESLFPRQAVFLSTGVPFRDIKGQPVDRSHEFAYVSSKIASPESLAAFKKLIPSWDKPTIPKIAICGSGGGTRASLAIRSFCNHLAQDGLLPVFSYYSGLSGSTWFLGQYLHNELFAEKKGDLWNPENDGATYCHQMIGADGMGSSGVKANSNAAWYYFWPPDFVKESLHLWHGDTKAESGYNFVESWCIAVGKTYIGKDYVPKNVFLHALKDKLVPGNTHPTPWPLFSSVRKTTSGNRSIVPWYEFDPAQVRWLGQDVAIPTDLFGDQQNIKSDLSSVMGVCSSAVNTNLGDAFNNAFSGLHDVKEFVEGACSWWSSQPISSFFATDWLSKQPLELRDAGFGANIPTAPLLIPEREVDLIIIVDASAGVWDGAYELWKAALWAQFNPDIVRPFPKSFTDTLKPPAKASQADVPSGKEPQFYQGDKQSPSILYVPVASANFSQQFPTCYLDFAAPKRKEAMTATVEIVNDKYKQAIEKLKDWQPTAH